MLAEEKMSEAEVSLRLAFYLVSNDMVLDDVRVAIDGAQIRTGERVHFPIGDFLKQSGCRVRAGSNLWRGKYSYPNSSTQIVIQNYGTLRNWSYFRLFFRGRLVATTVKL